MPILQHFPRRCRVSRAALVTRAEQVAKKDLLAVAEKAASKAAQVAVYTSNTDSFLLHPTLSAHPVFPAICLPSIHPPFPPSPAVLRHPTVPSLSIRPNSDLLQFRGTQLCPVYPSNTISVLLQFRGTQLCFY
jgi:hypothetical protein